MDVTIVNDHEEYEGNEISEEEDDIVCNTCDIVGIVHHAYGSR